MKTLIAELQDKLGHRREKCSHEELRRFQDKWNLTLSPFFIALFTEVGNGGFGPGIARAKLPSLERLDEVFESQARDRETGLWEEEDWPETIAEFTGYGCSQGTAIDLGNPKNPVYYYDGDGGRGELYDSLSAYHESLESYLRTWIDAQKTPPLQVTQKVEQGGGGQAATRAEST